MGTVGMQRESSTSESSTERRPSSVGPLDGLEQPNRRIAWPRRNDFRRCAEFVERSGQRYGAFRPTNPLCIPERLLDEASTRHRRDARRPVFPRHMDWLRRRPRFSHSGNLASESYGLGLGVCSQHSSTTRRVSKLVRFLLELLTDEATRDVVHRHCPICRNREATLQRHFLATPDKTRPGPEQLIIWLHHVEPDRDVAVGDAVAVVPLFVGLRGQHHRHRQSALF